MTSYQGAPAQQPAAVDLDLVDDDLVPGPWRTLFSNDEWLMHRIVVYSTYGFLAIAIIAHILVFVWRPWLG